MEDEDEPEEEEDEMLTWRGNFTMTIKLQQQHELNTTTGYDDDDHCLFSLSRNTEALIILITNCGTR